MQKLIRITTIPLSLEKLLEGQLDFMNQNYEVIAISAEKDRLERYGRKNGVSTYHVEMTREITPLYDLKALWKLYSFLIKEKPLIVHTHTPKAGILGMLAAKMAGVPIRLHTVAGMPLLETEGTKRRILDAVEKLTYACATKVYPNSIGLHDIIVEQEYAAPDKLKLLGKGSSNGIDTDYFNPDLYDLDERRNFKSSVGIPSDDVVITFVGRLVADKGINELVEAFLELQKENNNTSLLLVGPFEQELDPLDDLNYEQIKEHPKIFSVGYQEDVRPYFAVSDILAFPSYREGFPNVVMQAGAMGLPSVVTDINGCNEIIEEGSNGIIIPVKDALALKSALQVFVENPEVRRNLGNKARKRITENFERKHFWEVLLKEYKDQESNFLGEVMVSKA